MVVVTLGVIERERPALATMIALACESVGHDCMVFKDLAQATRIIHAIRLDKIVIDIDGPGLNPLDWLEIMVPSWPDLPPRTLLLAESELAPRDVARIQTLGAEVVYTPSSLADAKRVVLERLHEARSSL
jgi:DNA-binding response OmpR family regulator